MLIKIKDDDTALLEELEQRATGAGPAAQQAATELRIRQAGRKGERDSAYHINFHFEHSPNWAVIHDLRVEHGGRVAQIDHLLINRWLEIYVLETKHFHAGIKITEDGEFLRWNAYRKTYEGMASPLEQNERHIAVLSDVVDTLDWPQRMGLRIAPAFHSLVLVSPDARIDRSKRFDSSRVIKADLLRKRIDKDFGSESPLMALLKTTAKLVSGDTVAGVARQLVGRHTPLRQAGQAQSDYAPRGRIEPTIDPALARRSAVAEDRAAYRTSAATGLKTGPSQAGPTVPVSRPNAEQPPAVGDASSEAPAAQRRLEPTSTSRRSAAETSAEPPRLPADRSAAVVPACKTCNSETGEILYGKYGYYFRCESCSTNTAIRFACQPGHKPRLRKEGLSFYRECADCGSSTLYHRNRD